MELDDLKGAWKALERQLERGNALQLQQLRDRKLDGLRRGLSPLCWGQALQIAFGAAIVLASVAFWGRHGDEPAMLATGVVMHAYGVATIAAGGITLGLVGRIDYAAPVVQIQKRLAALRRFYVISGLCVGLPWASLWVLVLVMLARAAGVDLYARAPGFVFGSLAVGAALIAALVGLHRWARDPRRPELARRIDEGTSGRSLRRAQAILEEVRRFEAE